MSYASQHTELAPESKSQVTRMLNLISEVRDYGYDSACEMHTGRDLEFIESLKSRTKPELHAEQKQLLAIFHKF